MPNIAWLTDIHLDFLNADGFLAFMDEVCSANPDAIVISGDIAEGQTLPDILKLLAHRWQRPIYFVLGNHDFYSRSIDSVRARMASLTAKTSFIRWLPEVGVMPLSPTTALLGHDAWADGGYGYFMRSTVDLNDYHYIEDFKGLSRDDLLEKLQLLGQEAADYLARALPPACINFSDIYLVMHPPPFRETVLVKGKPARNDNAFLPHMGCKAVGDLLLELAPQYPDTNITVLCGHTHSKGEVHVYENLRVLVGQATYRIPGINRMIEIN